MYFYIVSQDKVPVCPFSESEVTNVALHKDATQSTTYSIYEANKAVDGNTSQTFYPDKSCSHTTLNPNLTDRRPWLNVDLQGQFVVQYVKLYSRSDPCCAHRYHNLEVRVGDEYEYGQDILFHKNQICGRIRGGGYPRGHIFVFNCTSCLIGKWVSVQIVEDLRNNTDDTNILSVCELEVYGIPVLQ